MLEGFAFGGYRSFGPAQKFAPLRKINLLAGANNSGKSNVLRFLDGVLPIMVAASRSMSSSGTPGLPLGPLDRHRGGDSAPTFAVALEPNKSNGIRRRLQVASGALLDRLIEGLSEEDGLVWLWFSASNAESNRLRADPAWIERVYRKSGTDIWRAASRSLVSIEHGNPIENLAAVARVLISEVVEISDVALVPAIRQVGGHADAADLSGADIIHRLADLQGPSIHELEKRTRFDAITQFLRAVLERPDVNIRVPNQRDTLHVETSGRTFPLEYLGTGIHEVMMLAAWATLHENQLLCIEEPELHLHPLLQRKLVAYLATKTSNQYFLSTHSAHFLDEPGATIFHTSLVEHSTTVTRAVSSLDRVRVCADLGYRATDLVQANAVVWVEGPSDRLYIGAWLRQLSPELIEGIHYSIMFYGGRLLNSLSANDEELSDFISLRRLNQWLVVVMDSDRTSARAPLSATKRRVRDDFSAGPSFAWVTAGREIENYIEASVLLESVKVVHPTAVRLKDPSRYARAYEAVDRRGRPIAIDKLKVARQLVSTSLSLDVLDLRKRTAQLVRFIKEANGVSR